MEGGRGGAAARYRKALPLSSLDIFYIHSPTCLQSGDGSQSRMLLPASDSIVRTRRYCIALYAAAAGAYK